MIRKKLLNFTLYQIIHYYGHIDGFTRDTSPRLNFFLFGVYYNLNIFQIYYSISFLKTFFFVYNNVTIKGLPSLVISSVNLFKKKTASRFLQYYSFGNWTYGLFSNWLYCKSFLNITKYPFLNRKIKTIPRIIIGLNNNFFLEREIKNTYTSILSFTFVNSNHFDAKRYFAPYNTDSIVSLNFYLKIFYLLHDRSSLIKLHFFWSFNFFQKIFQGRLLKIFFKTFKKRGFFTRHYKQKNYLKKKRRALRRYQLKIINRKVVKYPVAAYFDPIFRVFEDRMRITKLVVRNRAKLSGISPDHPLLIDDDDKPADSWNRTASSKQQFYKFFSKNKKIQYFLKKNKKKKKSVNFIFNYFKLLLDLLVKEKYLDRNVFEFYITNILRDNFLVKIKKLVIFKIFLRHQKFLLSRHF